MKPSADPAADVPPTAHEESDSESDDENRLEYHTRPRTLLPRKRKQTPREYIEDVIGVDKFCLPSMTASNYDVASSNAAECGRCRKRPCSRTSP